MILGQLEAWTPVALLLVVALRCWVVVGEFPPGVDAANLLLAGRELLGLPNLTGAGPRGDALVPLPLWLLGLEIGPLLAARLLALGSLLAVTIAHYVLARRGLPPVGAASLAGLAAACPGLGEPTLMGAYQQNVAFASLVLVVGPTVDYLGSGARRTAVGVSLGLLVVALSHWAYTPIALTAVAGCALLAGRPAPWTRLGLTLAATPALLAWIAFSLRMLRRGYVMPNEWTHGLTGLWGFMFREPLWSLAAAVGLLAVLFHPRIRRSPARAPSLALIFAGVVAALVVPHPRVMPPVVTAALIGLALLAKDVLDRQLTAARSTATAALTVALLVALLVRADHERALLRQWYRTLDRDYVELVAWVGIQPPPTALAAVNAGAAGQPEGLWLAVLTAAPTLVGADPALLGYPEELVRAHRATSFFEPHRSWPEASALASGEGIGVLVSAKDALPQWRDWVRSAGPDAIEAGRYVGFRVRPRLRQPPAR